MRTFPSASPTGTGSKQAARQLTELETEFVTLLGEICHAFGLPPSRGFIYGLALISEEPVTFDDVVGRLGISSGSASQGLRWLKHAGLLKPLDNVPSGNAWRSPNPAGRARSETGRREHLVPASTFATFLEAALRERVFEPLQSGHARLQRLRARLKSVSTQDGTSGRGRGQSCRLRARIDEVETFARTMQQHVASILQPPG